MAHETLIKWRSPMVHPFLRFRDYICFKETLFLLGASFPQL